MLACTQSPGAARRAGFFNVPEMKNLLPLLCLLPLAAHALDLEKTNWGKFEHDFEEKPWVELEAQLPPAPKPENLLPFFVSSATENRFFIDSASLSRGDDEVLRYTLVIKSSSGAVNVSYEGMRCSSRELKRYAFGRTGGSWSKARNTKWEPISYQDVNRQHHMLYDDFLCPRGIAVKTAKEAIDAIKKGGHPEASGLAW